MGIRKKGRGKFDYHGRLFVWWIDNEIYLRIASDDKRFVIGYLLVGESSLLAVHGPDFPGLEHAQRPYLFTVPPLRSPDIGRHVGHILDVCFQSQEYVPFTDELPEYGSCL